MPDAAKAIKPETNEPALASRMHLASTPRGREVPPHAPTHYCPTPRMSGEDPHPPRDVQSSAGPHKVGLEGETAGGIKKKNKTKTNVSAASPLPVDPEDMLGLRWERYAGLRGRVL